MRQTNILILLVLGLSFLVSAFANINQDIAPEEAPEIAPGMEPVDPTIQRYLDYAVAAGSIVFGLLWLFLGYRLIRVVLFLCGFATFFVICLYLVTPRAPTLALWLVYTIAAAAGVVGGLLFVALSKLGYFLFGFVVGVLLAALVIAATPIVGLFSSGLIPLIIVLCTGVVVAICTVIFSRALLIIGTSFNGTILIATTLDKLFYQSSLESFIPDLLDNVNNRMKVSSGWEIYLIFAGIVLVTLIGVFVQFRFTARGYHHGVKERREDEYPLLIQANV